MLKKIVESASNRIAILSMALYEREEIDSRLKQIIIHLLKCEYQPEKKSMSWVSSISGQRKILAGTLADKTFLNYAKLPETLRKVYTQGRSLASKQTGIDVKTFPTVCPWTIDQILDSTFYPNADSWGSVYQNTDNRKRSGKGKR